MGWMPAIDEVLYLALAVAAWAVSRRDRSHRPLAAYITWMATSELVRTVLAAVRDRTRNESPTGGPALPYTGLGRIAVHGDHFFVLSWSFLFIAVCLHYFLGQKKPWAPIVAWLALFVGLTLSYPAVRGHALGLVYETVTFGTLLISWGCILWAILRRRGVEPKLAHLALILYASTDVATSIIQGTHDFFKGWPVAQLSNMLLLSALIAVHVRELARRGRVEEAIA